MHKRYVGIFVSLVIAAATFGGCASDHGERVMLSKQNTKQYLNNIESYKDYKSQFHAGDKQYKIKAKNMWAYTLVKKIARKKHIPVDTSFIPSSEYRVYANGNYTFNSLLDMVRKQTGIHYIVSDGYVKVKNKEFINQYFSSGHCGKGSSRFSVSLKNAPLGRIFGYFVEKKGYTVYYDLHFHQNINEFQPITFVYRGCSVREALQRIAKMTDLKIIYKKNKMIEIRDYDTLKADVPSYYDLSFKSSDNSLGEDTKGTGTKLSDRINAKDEFKNILQGFMSEDGRAYVSNRGYLIIEDKPSYITRIKEILNKEVAAQQNIDLDITVVSVELNDQYSSGVDWQKILEPVLHGYKIGFGITSAGNMPSNSFNAMLLEQGSKNNVLSLLGEYGKTKIVKEHHLSTRGGTMSTLKAVDIIPYIIETSQLNGTTSQIQREAKSVESGIIMNIKPNLDGDNVNMNVDIMVSEYLGDKEFSDGFKLPMIKQNVVQSPLSIKLGDTALLTGISTDSDTSTYAGIPGGHKVGDFGIFGGENKDGIKRTEYLIFIKPTKASRK